MYTVPGRIRSPSAACTTSSRVRRRRISAIKLRWRGSRCWTPTTAAGKPAGRLSRMWLMAAMPPADDARATTSNCAPGKRRDSCGASTSSGSVHRDTGWTNSSRSHAPCYPSNLVSALRSGKRSIGVMARVNTPSQPMTELYLIQGEVPDTRDLDDARQWVTIYRELVTFADRTLNRLRREVGGKVDGDGLETSDADLRGMEGHLRRLQTRLDFWERRLWDLAGLDLDIRRRVLTYAGKRLTLTRREAELLSYLARRPRQFFSATQ